MAHGSGTMTSAATYSFSAQPRPVAGTRKKFREPGETDISMYRDLKETCITWDKRVHRGNTYSMYTQNAIKEALQDAVKEASPKPRRRKKVHEANVFDMPLPEKERIPVDLTSHLTAKEVVVEVGTVEAQTDEFLPEPPKDQYRPQKTGIDVSTQVEDGELFNFDAEVEPILDVLVNKILEQSVMEVEEEHEMSSMTDFKEKWNERQKSMMKDWQAQLDVERELWEKKEEIVKQRRLVKEREAQVLLKIQAVAAARSHLRNIVPNAVADLKELAFPDIKETTILRCFLPELWQGVQREVTGLRSTQQEVNSLVKACSRSGVAGRKAAVAEQRARHRELERQRLEEMQIRQGRIRIMMEDSEGNEVAVGPVQISTQDSIDAVQDRVAQWLATNRPDLAASWPHGVQLMLEGMPVAATTSIFEARAGQLSMVSKPAPAAPEDVDGDDPADGA